MTLRAFKKIEISYTSILIGLIKNAECHISCNIRFSYLGEFYWEVRSRKRSYSDRGESK